MWVRHTKVHLHLITPHSFTGHVGCQWAARWAVSMAAQRSSTWGMGQLDNMKHAHTQSQSSWRAQPAHFQAKSSHSGLKSSQVKSRLKSSQDMSQVTSQVTSQIEPSRAESSRVAVESRRVASSRVASSRVASRRVESAHARPVCRSIQDRCSSIHCLCKVLHGLGIALLQALLHGGLGIALLHLRLHRLKGARLRGLRGLRGLRHLAADVALYCRRLPAARVDAIPQSLTPQSLTRKPAEHSTAPPSGLPSGSDRRLGHR